MKNRKKAYIMSAVAVSLAAVLTVGGILSRTKEVLAARDTLSGIEEIVESANQESTPFTILEIVPEQTGTVSMDGMPITMSMGSIGYLIKGQEPNKLSDLLPQIPTREGREDFVSSYYGVLSRIGDTNADFDVPLELLEYQEVTEAEYALLPEAERAGWESVVMNELKFAVSMNRVSGNFIRTYIPPEEGADPAREFFLNDSADTEFFKKDNTLSGDYYPAFTTDYTVFDADLGKYTAKFEKSEAEGYGFVVQDYTAYMVTSGNKAYKAGGNPTEDPAPQGACLYELQDGVLVYKGIVGENGEFKPDEFLVTASLEVPMRYAAGENPQNPEEEIVVPPGEDPEQPVEPAPEEKPQDPTPEPTPEIPVEPAPGQPSEPAPDGEQPVPDQPDPDEENPDGNTPSGNETPEPVGEGDKEYFSVVFTYQEGFAPDTVFYRIADYAKSTYGDYGIRSDNALYSSIKNDGIVALQPGKEMEPFVGVKKLAEEYYGKGNYAPPVGTLFGGDILYYKGGFRNKEWFKQYVLDRTFEEEFEGLYITVKTIPASEVTNRDVQDAGLIYLNNAGGEFWPDPDQGNEVMVYDMLHDLNADVAKEMLNQVISSHKALILDHSLADEDSEDMIMNMVAKILVADQTENAFFAWRDGRTPDLRASYYNSLASKTFVKKNVYIFNDFLSPTESTSDPWEGHHTVVNKNFHALMTGSGDAFREVTERTKLELEEHPDKSQLEEQKDQVFEAIVIRYILDYSKASTMRFKSSLKILEIEPTTLLEENYDLTVETDTSDPKKTLYKLFYTNKGAKKQEKKEVFSSEGRIELTAMSTLEFVGRIDDLNSKYDMIFFGADTSLMYRNSSTYVTNYNDSNMDGLIYTNVGDYTYMERYSGSKYRLLGGYKRDVKPDGSPREESEYTNYADGSFGRTRYSGNDIRLRDAEALIEFAKAGFPIVFADELVKPRNGTVSSDFSKRDLIPEDEHVDNTSYMYKLIWNLFQGSETRDSAFFVSELVKGEQESKTARQVFSRKLSTLKPELNILSPDISSFETIPLATVANGKNFIEVRFRIDDRAGSAGQTYAAKVYLDVNADGKYSERERMDNFAVYGDGGQVNENSLEIGREYLLRRELPETAAGVYPWKVAVVQNDSDGRRRDSKIGFLKVATRDENNDEDKVTIKVLQVRADKFGDAGAKETNLASYMSSKRSAVGWFLTHIPGFILDLTAKKSSEINNIVGVRTVDNYLNYFRQFDMLIVGYGDCYIWGDGSQADRDAMANALLRYIAEGNSVLFTHDTTSYHSTYDEWGYAFNRYIRNAVGMNRYAIMDNTPSADGNAAVQKILDNLVRSKESIYYPRSANMDDISTDLSASNGATELNRMENGEYVSFEGEGFTAYALQRFRATTDKWKKDRDTDRNDKVFLGSNTSKKNENANYTNVTQVNVGQMTEYPYHLGSTFKVARTHGQYWQLNLNTDDDGDGENDLVVWYCLSGSPVSGSINLKYNKNDARNMYYIYNRGNVTYSGQGHAVFDGDTISDYSQAGAEKATCAMEAKLLVNTIIACYSTGVQGSSVFFHEVPNYDSRRVKSVNLPYESVTGALLGTEEEFPDVEGTETDPTMTVYFEAEDLNVANGGKQIRGEFYYRTEDPVTHEEHLIPLPLTEVAAYTDDGAKVGALAPVAENSYILFDNTNPGAVNYRMFGVTFRLTDLIRLRDPDDITQLSNHPEIVVQTRNSVTVHEGGSSSEHTSRASLKLLRTQLFNLK